MAEPQIPILSYIKKNAPMRNARGEEYDYIMEDEIVIRIPFTKLSFGASICGISKSIIGKY